MAHRLSFLHSTSRIPLAGGGALWCSRHHEVRSVLPSRTAFPEFGFVYNYSVRASPWKNGTGDIAAEFVNSCKKYGIAPGYMGAMNNAFLNVRSGIVGTSPVAGQAVITQDQYTQILLAQLRQIWTDYGQLAEVSTAPFTITSRPCNWAVWQPQYRRRRAV